MFYIKKEISKLNTVRKIILDESNNLISESPEEVVNKTFEIEYYFKQQLNFEEGNTIELDRFVDFPELKTLFETEEEANTKLSFILQDPMFEKGDNITYSVESE